MNKKLILSGLLLLSPYIAQASAIYEIAPDNGHVYMSSAVTTTELDYDANTDQFTGLFEGPGFGAMTEAFGLPAYNISGTFNLDATIDEDGTLSGGNVSWVGGGDGIPAGTNLLQGNLVDFKYNVLTDTSFPDLWAPEFGSFDFIIEVTASDPLLNFTGYLYLILYFTNGPINPFESSFFMDSPYTGQDLYSIFKTDIPEPAGILLMGLGLAALGFARKKRC